MQILPPKTQCCCSIPLHLPFKPSSTRTTARIHFHLPATRKFPWPGGFRARRRRFPHVLSSTAPQFPPNDAAGSSAEDFTVELGRLLALLPEEMRRRVSDHPELPNLIEVVMDLGRKPLARFPSGDFVLSDHPITIEDIQHATSQVR